MTNNNDTVSPKASEELRSECDIYELQSGYMHDRYKMDLEEDLTIFLTITLRPKLYKFQAITQYEISLHTVIDILDKHMRNYSIVAELTKECNVHYHVIGHARGISNLMRLLDSSKKNRVIGFIKRSPNIHNIESLDRAIHYILKDIPNTNKIISRPGYYPQILIHG